VFETGMASFTSDEKIWEYAKVETAITALIEWKN
jgi:hypothetical protein